MVITVILLRHLWRVWRQRENDRSEFAGLDRRELADIGITDAERQAALDASFWRAVLADYRHKREAARARRVRTQAAVARLSRMRSASSEAF